MLDRLRSLIRTGRYRLTLHAEQERDADEVSINDIEAAFSGPEVEAVEDYPDDPRGHSVLILGFTEAGEPLHAAWSLHENMAILVTYRPDPRLWTDLRKRKGARA